MKKIILVIAALIISASAAQAQVGNLIWEEEFNDLDNWLKVTGNGSWGWGNGELEYYKEENAVDYLREYIDPFFATGFDPLGRNSIEWGVSAPPETFIIDGDGTVLFRFTGPLIGSNYEQRFLPALEAARGMPIADITASN